MKTEIVNLMESIDGTSTNVQGCQLYSIISNKLDNDIKVQLSLKDSTPMSSSFMNSSFGELVEKYGVEKLRSHLVLINYKPYLAESIKLYIKNLNSHIK